MRLFCKFLRFQTVLVCVMAISACQQLTGGGGALYSKMHIGQELGEHSGGENSAVPTPRWWRASFQIEWDGELSPDWHYGPLVAEQVILPVMQRYGEQFQFWRFHRRAVGDAAGHRFSFLYYADSKTAGFVEALIRQNKTLANLIGEGAVTRVDIGPYSGKGGGSISATSDKNWTPVMQQTWPYFLMGVSQMWLQQVVHFSENADKDSPFEHAGFDGTEGVGLEEQYIYVQSKLNGMWLNEGRHAYLHHLNAIYAYQPVLQRF